MLIMMDVLLLPLMKADAHAHFHHWVHGGEKRIPSASPVHTFITIKWPSSLYERFCHDGGAVSLTDLEMMLGMTQVCKCCRLMLCKVSTVFTDNTKAREKKCQY